MSDEDQLRELGQKLASALAASYEIASPGSHLAFLPGGVSVPADIVQAGVINPTQMQTWLAMNFDSPFIMSAADCTVHQKDASRGTASRIYTIAATSAQPLGDPQNDSWKRVDGEIAAAQRCLGPPDQQKPIVCMPDDWVLPANTGYWSRFDSTQAEAVSTGPRSPPPPVNPQYWRVRSHDSGPVGPYHLVSAIIPRTEMLARLAPQTDGPAAPFAPRAAAIGTSRLGAAAATSFSPRNLATLSASSPSVAALSAAAAPRPSIWQMAAERGVLSEVGLSALFASAQPVANVTTTQSATIAVHLEHQCVTLGYLSAGQPWWDGVFLADTGWFIPGMSRGGLLPTPGGADGQIYGLPIAIVIVRNLRVSGHWTAEAAAALGAAGGALGPLSLFGAGRSVEVDGAVTYARDGMQVIALLCSAIPVLPPVDAPAPSPPGGAGPAIS